MIRRNHTSVEAAIHELMTHRYLPRHRSDGLIVHSDGKTELAVARETRARSSVWHLVPAPMDRSA